MVETLSFVFNTNDEILAHGLVLYFTAAAVVRGCAFFIVGLPYMS
jgi:hypothetical protein